MKQQKAALLGLSNADSAFGNKKELNFSTAGNNLFALPVNSTVMVEKPE